MNSTVERMNEICESMKHLDSLPEIGMDEVSLYDELFDELLYLQRELFLLIDEEVSE